MNTKPNILIFSVFNDDAENNRIIHEDVKTKLIREGIQFKQMEGLYYGKPELSFLVEAKHEALVKDLCKKHKQHSYLYSHNDRTTEEVLVSNGQRKKLGVLKAQGKKPSSDYTFDPNTGFYWVIA